MVTFSTNNKVAPVRALTAYEGVEVQLHSLTSSLDGVSGQLHAAAIYPRGKDPGTH
jgi:hypothetical protein